MRTENGRIAKDNITLIEYGDGHSETVGNFFVQCGVAGIFASEKELKNLFDVLNYYFNIDSIAQCKVKIGGKDVAVS